MNLVFLLLVLVLVLAFIIPLFLIISESFRNIETFSNYTLDQANGDFPKAQTEVLVEDTYPAIGKNQISDNNSSDIWWQYPVFKLGSYKQITNNIRYPDTPDEGTCMPASMCGALYNEKFLKTNYIEPLPQLNPECGTRVGYFDTDVNLLPYRTNMQNILY